MELIFMWGAVACVGIGGIAGVYHWANGGSPMDDICVGGLAANVMLFAALLTVMF